VLQNHQLQVHLLEEYQLEEFQLPHHNQKILVIVMLIVSKFVEMVQQAKQLLAEITKKLYVKEDVQLFQ